MNLSFQHDGFILCRPKLPHPQCRVSLGSSTPCSAPQLLPGTAATRSLCPPPAQAFGTKDTTTELASKYLVSKCYCSAALFYNLIRIFTIRNQRSGHFFLSFLLSPHKLLQPPQPHCGSAASQPTEHHLPSAGTSAQCCTTSPTACQTLRDQNQGRTFRAGFRTAH